MEVQNWLLELGGETVARIRVDTFEFPWLYGDLIDSPGFDRFRTYFGDDELWPETSEFEALCAEIRRLGGFVLRDLADNREYKSFRLNHDGNVVWFRHADK